MIGFTTRPCYIKSGKIDWNSLSFLFSNSTGGFDIYVNDELRHVTDISSVSVDSSYKYQLSDIESNQINFLDSLLRISNRIADQLHALFYLEGESYLYLSPFPNDCGSYSISYALPPTDETQYDLSSLLCLTEETGAVITSSSIVTSGDVSWNKIKNFNTTSFYVKINDESFPSVLAELASAASAGFISAFRYDQSRNFVIRNTYDGKDVFIKYNQYLIKKFYLNNHDYENINNKNQYMVYYGATEEQIRNLEQVV